MTLLTVAIPPCASAAALRPSWSALSPGGMREPLPKTSQPASSQEPGASSVPCPQVRLALLQLKGLEDSYNGHLDFPRDRITVAPFGFL